MKDSQWFIDRIGTTMEVLPPNSEETVEIINGAQINLLLHMQDLGYIFFD